MTHKAVWAVLVVAGLLFGAAAWAQVPRLEVGFTAGTTLGDGVTGGPIVVPDVGTFNSIDPKDSFSWGLRASYFINPNVEVGFLFSQQLSTLQISGQDLANGFEKIDLGDLSIYNYHAFVAYNFNEYDAVARPYFLFGLGATDYGSVTTNVRGAQPRTLNGGSKFSPTMGVGVKLYPRPRFGFRAEARYTPTYIKSDTGGWWCDPYWGCYIVEDPQYANQFELSGGVFLRF